MPKTISKILPYFVIIFIAFSGIISCQKELSYDGQGGNIPGVNTRTSIEGRIIDESGMPVPNASVKAGLNTTSTDKNGFFKIENASFTTSETFVTVTKSGYFKGTRTFFPRENSNNYIKIQLLRKTISARIDASAGGDVAISSDNGNIHFESNSFVTAAGLTYNGTVLIATQYLDPTSTDIADQMPGDLRGISSAGAVVGLKSYGMIAVELMDDAGMPLKMKPGMNAAISMNIPVEQLGYAPSTIPLWHFNDSTGLWKQEGSANRVGDSYEGTVSHFSFWNCDDPFDFVKLEAKIVNSSGNPVQYAKVQLTDNTGFTAYDYTDINGLVDGFVPKNQSLAIQILNTCGEVAFSNNIGPFTADINLGNIAITQNLINIQGTAVNCSGAPLTDGYVQVLVGNVLEIAPVTNGVFNANIISCQGVNSVQVIAVDNAAQKQSPATTVNLSGSIVNVGQLTACGISSETFFTLTLAGTTLNANTNDFYRYAWKEVWDTTSGGADYYYAAFDSLVNKYIFIAITLPANHVFTTGTTNSLDMFMGYKGITNSSEEVILSPLGGGPHSINFTEYGIIGQYIAGSYTGSVQRDFSNNGMATLTDTVNASFNFRVKHVSTPF